MALPRVPTSNNQQYTLDAKYTAGGTSLTLNTTVSSVILAPGYCVVDRVDTSGNKTATKRTYYKFTGVSGAQLTGISLADGTDQDHQVGAVVEIVPDVKYEADWYSWAVAEHDTLGAHGSLPSLAYVKSQQVSVGGVLNASGASLQGITVSRPVWVFTLPSAASVALGSGLPMLDTASFQSLSVVLSAAISSASLILDVNKNGTTIFTDQNTRLSVAGGGTYASTASISVKAFSPGDVLTVDVDGGGTNITATVVGRAS